MSTVKCIMVKKKKKEKEKQKKEKKKKKEMARKGREKKEAKLSCPHQIPGDLFQEAQRLALEDQGQVSPGNYFKENKTKNCFSRALRLRGSGTQRDF